MKPKTGLKKRPRKCFEKPPKKRCILRARYAFKLPSRYQICALGAHADALMHLKSFRVERTMLLFKHTSTMVDYNKTTHRRFPPTQVAPWISSVSMP